MQPTSKESGTLPGPAFIPFSVDEYSQLLLWKEFAEAAATVDCLVEVGVFKAEQAGHHISKMQAYKGHNINNQLRICTLAMIQQVPAPLCLLGTSARLLHVSCYPACVLTP